MKKMSLLPTLEEFIGFFGKDFEPFVMYDENSDEIVCQLKDCSFCEIEVDRCTIMVENHTNPEDGSNWIGIRFNASEKIFDVCGNLISIKDWLPKHYKDISLTTLYFTLVHFDGDLPNGLISNIYHASCRHLP